MKRNPPVIIFADHDLTWSRPVRAELRRRGAQGLPATTATQLLQLAERRAPDLVVLAGDLDGVDPSVRIALLRGRYPGVRVAVVQTRPPEFPGSAPGALLFAGTRGEAQQGLLEAILSRYSGLEADSEAPSRPPAMLMCVDDDAFYLSSLARILRRHGYRVATFEGPDRTLEAVPEVRPELVILDLIMPGMDGLDLAEEIQESSRGKIPIVMLTARCTDDDITEGYRHGASYYIPKPCDPRTVLNIVDYLVGDIDPLERKLLEVEL
jgi:DNA-binding response OmpR family regulator